MTADEALARLRKAVVPQPSWHVRKLEAAGGDLSSMVERVCAGEPIHRVIGRREFHGLDLALGPDTLEPRDDTEALVSLVLSALLGVPSEGHRYEEYEDAIASMNRLSNAFRFADLGTGTGAIALALLSHLRNARCVATDLSRDALAVAQFNAENARGDGQTLPGWTLRAPDPKFAERIELVQGSWLEPLTGTFDFIVSNPPYIASDVIPTLDPSVRDHDPHLALDGGADGLDAYRAILGGAAAHLRPGGFLALEIGYDQLAAITALAGETGWRVKEARQDLGERDRAMLLVPEQEPDRG